MVFPVEIDVAGLDFQKFSGPVLQNGRIDLFRIAFDLCEKNPFVEFVDCDDVDFVFTLPIPPAADFRPPAFLGEPETSVYGKMVYENILTKYEHNCQYPPNL